MSGQILLVLPRGQNGEIRCSTDVFGGRELVHFRSWAPINGELRPTKQGVAVSIKEVPELIDALAEFLAQSEQAPPAPPSAPPTPRPQPWRAPRRADRRPAYGVVRRSNPVAPSARPEAWSRHQKRSP